MDELKNHLREALNNLQKDLSPTDSYQMLYNQAELNFHSQKKKEDSMWSSYVRAANVPPVFQNVSDATIRSIHGNDVADKALFLSDHKKGAFIYGGVGRGKTYLLYFIIRRMIEQSYSRFIFYNMLELEDRIFADQREYGSARYFIESLCESEVLLLDDVGIEGGSDSLVRAFQKIFDYRWNFKLPTIITTNLSFNSLEDKFGSRIASRLSNLLKIEVSGVDLRRNGK